ncbi:MAG TPA: hypothetical protein ENI07_15035 [Desulfobacterales bacterium]|nr:hypothetical protein [Desulfobacterales bacterium]
MNDELKLFIKDITLFLQKHSNYNADKIEPMFQRAYKLYAKYDVEKKGLDSEKLCGCPIANPLVCDHHDGHGGCGFKFDFDNAKSEWEIKNAQR